MADILQKIITQTETDFKRRRREIPERRLESFEGYEKERKNFRAALVRPGEVSVIAEVKKASPSKGVIRADFDPVTIARQYEEGGAAALSVLTDKPFFQGDLSYLEAISKVSSLPLLRKDFIIDPYQVKEARAYGADAVLIIVTAVSDAQLRELLAAAAEFGLDALTECYDMNDFERLDFDSVNLLGVNNRNLKDFKTDVHRGTSLLKQAPAGTTLVSESGLSEAEDIALLHKNGIHAALIGEHFMRKPHPGKAVSELLESAARLFPEEEQ